MTVTLYARADRKHGRDTAARLCTNPTHDVPGKIAARTDQRKLVDQIAADFLPNTLHVLHAITRDPQS
jgi:hypothetical protein